MPPLDPPRPDPARVVTPEITAVVVFAERLRFFAVLRDLADVHDQVVRYGGALDGLLVLDMTTEDARAAWPGTSAVAAHARTLRLTGWTDEAGAWWRE